MGDLSVK